MFLEQEDRVRSMRKQKISSLLDEKVLKMGIIMMEELIEINSVGINERTF